MSAVMRGNGSASLHSWRSLREQALERDHGRCVLCGDTATHVHHRQARRDGGRDVLSNLESLCAEHHRAMHAGMYGAPRRAHVRRD